MGGSSLTVIDSSSVHFSVWPKAHHQMRQHSGVLACVCAQSHLIHWDPVDYSPPGSYVHGIFQARILE